MTGKCRRPRGLSLSASLSFLLLLAWCSVAAGHPAGVLQGKPCVWWGLLRLFLSLVLTLPLRRRDTAHVDRGPGKRRNCRLGQDDMDDAREGGDGLVIPEV